MWTYQGTEGQGEGTADAKASRWERALCAQGHQGGIQVSVLECCCL